MHKIKMPSRKDREVRFLNFKVRNIHSLRDDKGADPISSKRTAFPSSQPYEPQPFVGLKTVWIGQARLRSESAPLISPPRNEGNRTSDFSWRKSGWLINRWIFPAFLTGCCTLLCFRQRTPASFRAPPFTIAESVQPAGSGIYARRQHWQGRGKPQPKVLCVPQVFGPDHLKPTHTITDVYPRRGLPL